LTEKDAPLLNRNRGYITPDNVEDVIERAKKWVDLVNAKGDLSDLPFDSICDDPATNRIFTLDAERTFRDSANRSKMTDTLCKIWSEVQDYHQGLGFIVAFLLLFLDKQETIRIAIALHRFYVNGYFKSAPVAYVRDSKVYQQILEKFYPEVAAHVGKMAPPEAYCSKWFVGFNVHVFPFEALAAFLDEFLSRSGDFMFQHAMGVISNCENDILESKDVSRTLAILRLDASVYPDDTRASKNDKEGSFFTKIVEDAVNFNLEGVDLETLRAAAMIEIEVAAEKRKQREIELGLEDSEDEIVFSDEEEEEL